MTTTFAVDADVSAADARAVSYLPSTDSGSFNRFRVLAKAEVLRRLSRRQPPVYEGNLSDTTELTEAEVRFTLHFLYREAASRAGENDKLWAMMTYWKNEAETEIGSVQVTVGEDEVRSVQGFSAPIWRS